MADKITYSINCTPIEELTTENNTKVTTIASEIGKSLGCSGQVVVTNYGDSASAQGYANKEVNYFSVPTGSESNDLSDQSDVKFVFIKNTGHKFESTNRLGVPLSRALKVSMSNAILSYLNEGEAIVFKSDLGNIDASNIHLRTVNTDGSADTASQALAVEYLVID